MKFVNRTTLPGALLRTTIDQARIAASVLARATFTFEKGEPTLADEQPWKICKEPIPTEHGIQEMDQVLRKGGVDLFLFGTVVSQGRAPTTAVQIELDVGRFSRRALVFGDRIWRRGGTGLVASPPKPFTTMPLVLERAFGGTTTWDQLEVPHPDNANGLGFYSSEQEAAGQPLPNIEEADMPIRNWSDRPITAGFGFCSMQSYLRLSEGLKVDRAGLPIEITSRLFNAAFPRMTAPAVAPGDRVRIVGMSAGGRALEFSIPTLSPVLGLKFDAESYRQEALIEQVGFEVDRQRMFVTYRFPFRYVTKRGQLRSCELAMA